MTVTTLNGRPPRKQLSEQLDRLDGIIESLADGLPDAVRHALREALADADPNPVSAEPMPYTGRARLLRAVADAAAAVQRSDAAAYVRAEVRRLKSAVLLGTAVGVVTAAVVSPVHPLTAVLIAASAAGVAAAVVGR